MAIQSSEVTQLMRSMIFPESGSKRKLLDAAEQLFAQKGFEAVSVRDITGLAKTNVAAVNYHFGSRDALVSMTMMRYMTSVTEERLARLDALEKKWAGRSVPLEEIIDAFVRPLITQVRKSELSEQLFYKLVGRIFAQPTDQIPQSMEQQIQQALNHFTRAFAKTLPTVSGEDLAWRMHFMAGGMIHMLMHPEWVGRLISGSSGNPSMEATLGRFVHFTAAGLREGTIVEESPERGPQTTFDF